MATSVLFAVSSLNCLGNLGENFIHFFVQLLKSALCKYSKGLFYYISLFLRYLL
uniref:Uncharacterized protein n=1 Tax=Anguilla anguilla TaxID=7936 RepID=A0A0E9XV19_ANGAN